MINRIKIFGWPLIALAGLVLLGGCSHDTWSYKAVPDVALVRSESLANSGPLLLKTESADSAAASTSPRQTVLIVNYMHDMGSYRSSVGQTLVVTLDGPLKPGQYWLTPDNAVLLTYSSYSAPMRERAQLRGSINIDKVTGTGIVAHIAVIQLQDVEATGFIEHPYDPAYQLFPFQLSGERTFEFVSPNDASMDGSAVKWKTE
jgi:hypothetical protein